MLLFIAIPTPFSVTQVGTQQTPKHKRRLRQFLACSIITVLARLRCSGSNVTRRELEETSDPIQRNSLRLDFLELVPVAKDEKVLGFSYSQTDPYGGFVTDPLVSDVQDENLAKTLEAQRLPKRDAQHLAQAISNGADVFLTRDERHFINKRGTLEKQFPIRIQRPSELSSEIEATAKGGKVGP